MPRRFLLLLVTLVVLIPLAAQADEWKKEFTTSGKLALRIDSNDADIRIISWDRKDTAARITTEGYKLGADDVQVIDRQSGDNVEIQVRKPRRLNFSHGVRNQWIHIEVSVPREADLNLHTGDGSIRVDNVTGQLHLDSGDGNVEVRAADGPLVAATGDGNIQAQGRFDSLDLHTGDGNVDAEVASGSHISSSWMVRTGDGNISVRLPQGFAADLDAETGDGRVNVQFPVMMSGSLHENSVRGKMNGGGAPLELRTGDGNITLDKS